MFDIKSFTPKIVERTPKATYVHDTIEDYWKNRSTWKVGPNPAFSCRKCGKVHHSEERLQREPCLPTWSLMNGKKHLEEQHDVVLVARVSNELGDDLELYVPNYSRYSWLRKTPRELWMNGRQSPQFRGLLPLERPHNEWAQRYRLYPEHVLFGRQFRHPKTFNELRQIAASEVDERAPKVRAKRGKRALPTAWDDKYYSLSRSWKKKKVRKQWMVNATR